MSLSKASKSRSGELQWKETDVDVHDHRYWHCPDCSYFNNIISDKCPQITHSNRSCILKIIWILGLIISVVIIVPLILLHLWINPNKGLSNADTSYAANEGRLFEVSAFFKEKVGISVSDHYNVTATLHILKQSPPLTRKYGFSVKTTVIYDEDSSYSSDYWHYYLHRKSNVTIWACVDSVCDPYHIYIVKGPQNYASWLKTHHSEESVFVNTEICSYGLPSLLNYTVEEDDHYYFFYYSTGQCHRNDIIHAYKKAGNLSFYVEKFEYSVSNVQAWDN